MKADGQNLKSPNQGQVVFYHFLQTKVSFPVGTNLHSVTFTRVLEYFMITDDGMFRKIADKPVKKGCTE